MKRFLLIFILLFVAAGDLSAQRDNEHWIAPIYESTSNTNRALYISTDSVVPFVVTISSNSAPTAPANLVIGTVTVSKGNPQVFVVQKQYIATSTATDAFQVRNFGLHLTAPEKFFCTLRLTNGTQHAEILTSKGKAALGKEFYSVHTPSVISGTGNNFTAGVLATEDNTTITATWNTTPAPVFINATPPTNSHTVTLNKGQSFLFAGTTASASNAQAFTGAKIVADKNITLTNGSNTGNFGTGFSSGTDIIMDQSVPVERLGNEFAMVRSKSATADLEGGIVVATENNTQIFLNGAATAAATLNAGQFYRISGNDYVLQGGTAPNQHYNMIVNTSKNVYLYQLVSFEGSNATGGFNYIPPLNCFLPRVIDEIALVNQMPTGTGGASVVPSGTEIKLNIITEAGAVVLVNGTPPPAGTGPFPLTGNTIWVTYGIEPVVGNLTISSTKAVTAGINGGYSTSGYGGFFAGFSSIPLISKQTGDCIPGMILEVDDSYDTYQWNLNGVPIPGATQNTYVPTVAGNYTCTVGVAGCASVTTPIFKVFTCLKNTVVPGTACAAVTIVPTFTNSTQTVAPGTVTIITAPVNGTATIDPSTGVITYTPNAGYIGTDTLVYQFCGIAPEFIDCEKVTVNFTVPTYPVVQNATLTTCFIPATPAKGLFDLTTANVTATAGITKKYYPSITDANNGTNEILNFANLITPSTEVFVKVSNAGGCYKIAKITLVVTPQKFSLVLKDKNICLEDRTTLDAGPGYTAYLWSTGATTQSITGVGVGEYTVTLTSDGCETIQTVKVLKYPDPVVTNVEITNNTVTITAAGGNPPYQYSSDNIVFQDSNVFSNLPRGQNTFYVKDINNCEPVTVEITVPNLINAITPNGDSKNDYVDYSVLAYKQDMIFTVYDRYGNKVHVADKNNGYRWDGKFNDRKVYTGTYWYSISWIEPNAKKTPVKYTGWILVKNKE